MSTLDHWWQVPKRSAGERLDRFVHQVFVDARGESAPSRRQIRRWIDEGRVYVERRRCRTASRAMVAGHRVEVAEPQPTEDLPPGAEPSDFQVTAEAVIFEDEHLLALHKPAGVASQATRQSAQGHLLAAAERWVGAGGRRGEPIWLHHRLDRGTSGVIVLAKSRDANRGLSMAFAERQVEKRYQAVVLGRPADAAWTIDAPLVRVRGDSGRPMSAVMDDVVMPEGSEEIDAKPALTEVERLDVFNNSALLDVRPKTGRMHQIRVHLASQGHPVLGDRLYGSSEGWRLAEGIVERPLLHAAELRLQHPVSRQPLHLEADLPGDLKDWLGRLRAAGEQASD